jgi:hypothetical protein
MAVAVAIGSPIDSRVEVLVDRADTGAACSWLSLANSSPATTFLQDDDSKTPILFRKCSG